MNQDFRVETQCVASPGLGVYCYFGCTRCLEPGFSGLGRIFRILVWGCSVILWVGDVLNQDFQDWKGFSGFLCDCVLWFWVYTLFEPGFTGSERIFRILVWGCTAISDAHAVLNQDFQDWKGFTGFWLGGVLCFRMCALS